MALLSELTSIYYLDSENRIISVNSDFIRFAKKNCLADFERRKFIGSRLSDHICDEPTKEIYQLLIENVRRTGQKVKLSYRADAPHLRRIVELIIFPVLEGQLEFRNVVVNTELREPVDLLDSSTKRSDQVLEMCSWCKGIKAPTGWVEVEEAIRILGLIGKTALPEISHEICEDCREKLHALPDL